MSRISPTLDGRKPEHVSQGEHPMSPMAQLGLLLVLAFLGFGVFVGFIKEHAPDEAAEAVQVEEQETPYVEVCFEAMYGRRIERVGFRRSGADIVAGPGTLDVSLDEASGRYCGKLNLVDGMVLTYDFDPFDGYEQVYLQMSLKSGFKHAVNAQVPMQGCSPSEHCRLTLGYDTGKTPINAYMLTPEPDVHSGNIYGPLTD